MGIDILKIAQNPEYRKDFLDGYREGFYEGMMAYKRDQELTMATKPIPLKPPKGSELIGGSKKEETMGKIYVAHPYGGEEENKQKVETIIKQLVKENPDNLYVSPIHCTGFYYHDVTYEKGMEYCFKLLDMCDTLLLCGDWKKSTGCCMEYGFSKARHKEIEYL